MRRYPKNKVIEKLAITYMNITIFPAAYNASGIRWNAIGKNGILKADTLAGIKQLIKADQLKDGE